jgi:hypothetical protein
VFPVPAAANWRSRWKNNRNRDAIADEAVGQTHGTAPPGTAKEKEAMSPEEAARRNAPAPAAQASTPEKTAAALGERVGDAYADAGNARQTGKGALIDRLQRRLSLRKGWPIVSSRPHSRWRTVYPSSFPINGS